MFQFLRLSLIHILFAIGIRAGEPEQLHTAQRGVGCDLFRAVHLPGHLLTGFVVLNDDVPVSYTHLLLYNLATGTVKNDVSEKAWKVEF